MFQITKTDISNHITSIICTMQHKADILIWFSNHLLRIKENKLNLEHTMFNIDGENHIYEYERQKGYFFNSKVLLNIYQIHDNKEYNEIKIIKQD